MKQKYISRDNLFVVEEDHTGNFNLRLTDIGVKEFGDVVNCIIQAKPGTKLEVHASLFSLETNKCLRGIRSPIAGKLTYINKDLETNPTLFKKQPILASFREINELTLERQE